MVRQWSLSLPLRKSHAFLRQVIKVWRMNLPAIAADIRIPHVIHEEDHNIWTRGRRRQSERKARNQTEDQGGHSSGFYDSGSLIKLHKHLRIQPEMKVNCSR